MAKNSEQRKTERRKRADPERDAPHRSVTEHIKRHARTRNRDKGGANPESLASETVPEAISEMVQVGTNVIEDQIRAGRIAAERLRNGKGNSKEPDTELTELIQDLVATTKDIGATWLDVLSNVVTSIAEQTTDPADGTQRGKQGAQPQDASESSSTVSRATRTEHGTSGSAATVSSITPADPAVQAVPPLIVVKGVRVREVNLDLRPPSLRFAPLIRHLLASDPNHSLTSVKFGISPNEPRLVLTVTVPRKQPPGVYSGVIVDESSNEPGGTLSVTVAH